MFTPRIGILTSQKFPEWKQNDHLLIKALKSRNYQAEHIVWNTLDAEHNDWKNYVAVIILSTWDYFENVVPFFNCIEEIEKHTKVLNNVSSIRWNHSKSYLRELKEKGIPTIESIWSSSEQLDVLPRLIDEKEWEECVIKPTISAGGNNTFRFNRENRDEVLSFFKDHPSQLIVQPFMKAFIEEGEVSFVFIGDNFSHAVLKRPAEKQFLVQDIHGGTVEPYTPTTNMINQARRVLEATEQRCIFARIDCIHHVSDENNLVTVEVEIVEPNLFLIHGDNAVEKLVDVIETRIEEGS